MMLDDIYLLDKVIELGVENGRLREQVESLEEKEEELVRILFSLKEGDN